jgi:hypothetical protein
LCDPSERPAREDTINGPTRGPEEEIMKKRSSVWAMAAAVAVLVGGFGGVARATILSAGGFDGENYNTGSASCVLSNTGTMDIIVKSVKLFDLSGAEVGNPLNGAIVHPGQTRAVDSGSAGFFNLPCSCVFDLSTKTGARASFVYTSGFNGSTVVIPATQK